MSRIACVRGFYRLQLLFARRVAEITGDPFPEVLVDHTILRNLLGVTVTREDGSDSSWQRFP